MTLPKNLRRQLKMLYVWYPKDRNELKMIHDENDVIENNIEFEIVKKELRKSKHACLVLRLEFPRTYIVLWIFSQIKVL